MNVNKEQLMTGEASLGRAGDKLGTSIKNTNPLPSATDENMLRQMDGKLSAWWDFTRMCRKVTGAPPTKPVGCPGTITHWKKTKPQNQHLCGHLYTSPTPKEHLLQKLEVITTNALALHICDVKLGTSLCPSTQTMKSTMTLPIKNSWASLKRKNSSLVSISRCAIFRITFQFIVKQKSNE